MLIEDLYHIKKDTPVLFRGKKALLHPYNDSLYLLHNCCSHDGSKPDDWRRYREDYCTSFWLIDTDDDDYDDEVFNIIKELKFDTITLGSL